MGNTKARQLYEANLPESFRRPQTDQYPPPSADANRRTFECAMLCVLSLFLLAPFCLFLSLNSDLRAVEFFIRDKYEKKKYYSKTVTNGSSVCIISSF